MHVKRTLRSVFKCRPIKCGVKFMKTEFIIQTGVETITTRLRCLPLSLEDLEVPELEINLAGKKRKDDKWLKMGN